MKQVTCHHIRCGQPVHKGHTTVPKGMSMLVLVVRCPWKHILLHNREGMGPPRWWTIYTACVQLMKALTVDTSCFLYMDGFL